MAVGVTMAVVGAVVVAVAVSAAVAVTTVDAVAVVVDKIVCTLHLKIITNFYKF